MDVMEISETGKLRDPLINYEDLDDNEYQMTGGQMTGGN